MANSLSSGYLKRKRELEDARENQTVSVTRPSLVRDTVENLPTADSINQRVNEAAKTFTERLQEAQSQPRKATLYDLTVGSALRGYNNTRYGEELYREMTGRKNEAERYRDLLADDTYNFETDGAISSAVSGAAELLGQMFRQYTSPTAVAGAAGGAGTAFVAGQLGPQALLPEEALTVPGAFLGGLQAGSAVNSYQVEAGLAYQEMLDNGVSEETARNIATGVGVGNAALELVQLDELADSFKILQRSGASDNILGAIRDEIVRRGGDVAQETLQEVAQEGVTTAGTQVASQIDRGEWAYDSGEVIDRLLDTAASSALSFGVLNVPGAARNVYAQRNNTNTVSNIPDSTRQAVDMLVNGEEISGNQAGRIAENADAVSLLSELTGVEIDTDRPISEVKADIRAVAGRDSIAQAVENGRRTPVQELSPEQIDAWNNRQDLWVDGADRVYQMDPASHIDQRTREIVGNTRVNAFQFDHPELHQFYQEAARDLIQDASLSTSAPVDRRRVRGNQGYQYISEILTSGQLRDAMNMGLSRNEIIRAAQDLIEDHGQENYAAAKRLEIVLDDMLSNGYTTIDGREVPPNNDYFMAKQDIPGFTLESREELPLGNVEGARAPAEIAYDINQVRRAASALGESGSRALTAAYDENVAMEYSPETIVQGFYQAYNSALNGTKLTAEQARNIASLPAQVRAAAESSAEQDRIRSQQASYFGERAGLVQDQTYRRANLSSQDGRRLDALAKALGVEIRFADNITDGDGREANARYENGTITLSLNAEDPVFTSVIHEAVHRIRETDPESYTALADFVQSNMSDESMGFNLETRSRLYGTQDTDALTEELVADAFGRMLDGGTLDRLVEDNRGVVQKVLDVIRDIIASVRRALNGQNVTLTDAQKAAFQDLEGRMGEMESLFSEAVERAETSNGTNMRHPTATARFSLKGQDQTYLDYVGSGDFDNAQRLVDEAAEASMPDSKIRGRNGKLTPVYHGTRDMFWRFDTTVQGGVNGTAEGFGIYTSDNPDVTAAYGDRQLKMFANITNPASSSEKTLSVKKLSALIKDTCEREARQMVADGEYDSIRDALRDTWVSNYTDTYSTGMAQVYKEVAQSILDMNDSDMDVIREIMTGMGIRDYADATKFYENSLIPVTGIDGFVTQWEDRGTGDRSNIILALNSNQLKSADAVTRDNNGKVIPLSQRFNSEEGDIRYSRSDREILDQMVEEYGAIPRGERPYREVSIPRRTSQQQKVSQTVRTILEAQATPEEAIPDIEKLVADGTLSYDPYSDKQAMTDAESTIKEKGYATALSDWSKSVQKGQVSKSLTAQGWALYNQAANAGDMKTAMTVLTNMVEHQRNAAQALQATRILKQMSPETQLYGVQRSAQNLTEEIKSQYGKDIPDIKVDEELARRFLEAKTDRQRDKAMQDLYKDIGKQMPSRFVDKWNAWRYFAMLGNPRTHVRNIVGNAFFTPVVAAKNVTATAIESAVYKVSGGRSGRSKAFVGPRDSAMLQAAWGDYANVEDQILGTGKYNDTAARNRYIQEGRVIFKNRALERARRANSAALDLEDAWFSKPHYAYALTQYCKANGITTAQIREGKNLDAARTYAIREAQRATYRDTNAFSEMISDLGRYQGKNPAKKAASTVLEGILPFRRTPANILVRGVEYSPLGLLKSLSYDLVRVKRGDLSATDAIDNISAGLTGTGLFALGALLAAEGLVRGAGQGEEPEREFAELQGHQAYSLEIGDQSYTLDWMAPECLPFFVGVNLWEQTLAEREDVTLSEVLNAVGTVTEPLLELSCLQSLNDVFDSVGYATSEGLGELPSALASAATSYLTQAIPTIFGQIERTAQGERMTTYTERDAFLTSDMQYALGSSSGRIPGWDYQQIPYIDAWGRTEGTGSSAGRAFDNFLNPAYRSTITETPMESELERLYEQTGDSGVLPSRAPRYITVDGERKDLTAQEYVKYAQQRGQTSYQILEEMTASDAYLQSSDEEKAEMISDAYTYANQTAKAAVSDYELEGWVAKAQEAERANISPGQYISLYEAQKSIESLKDKDGDTIPNSKGLLVMEMVYNVKGLTDNQRQILFDAFNVGTSVRHYNKARVQEKLNEMRRKAS